MLEIHHIHFPTIDSTQDYLKRECKNLDPNLLFCVTADEQTKGRGRGQNKWLSPPEKNLYISFHFVGEEMQNIAQLLSISTMKYLSLPLSFKWPNDLLMNHRKIAGIISEIVDSTHVISGLGLNVLMTEEECQTIDQPATSLLIETKKTYSIFELALGIASEFQQDLHLLKEQGFATFVPFINEHLAYKGKLMEIPSRGKTVKGIVREVTPKGTLLLEGPDGQLFTCH